MIRGSETSSDDDEKCIKIQTVEQMIRGSETSSDDDEKSIQKQTVEQMIRGSETSSDDDEKSIQKQTVGQMAWGSGTSPDYEEKSVQKKTSSASCGLFRTFFSRVTRIRRSRNPYDDSTTINSPFFTSQSQKRIRGTRQLFSNPN